MELYIYKDMQIVTCKHTDHNTLVLVVIDTHFKLIGLQELTCNCGLDFKDIHCIPAINSSHALTVKHQKVFQVPKTY
jgi:hypothetical protein